MPSLSSPIGSFPLPAAQSLSFLNTHDKSPFGGFPITSELHALYHQDRRALKHGCQRWQGWTTGGLLAMRHVSYKLPKLFDMISNDPMLDRHDYIGSP